MQKLAARANRHFHKVWFSFVCLGATLLLLLVVLVSIQAQPGRTANAEIVLAVSTPIPVVTYGATGDQRDIDIYPAIAYAPLSQRFLLVWLSLRNATMQSDGFDVYGQFLDQAGQPSGSQFRISDANRVARSNLPTVASDGTNFVVAWTALDSACRLMTQLVADSSEQADRVLDFGLTGHQHSPQLLYNAALGQYVLAFVIGDDYLPPVIAGATLSNVASCGSNASSTGEVRVAAFHFEQGTLKVDKQTTVSPLQGGAFRPAIALASGQTGYLLAWEDRRNGSGLPYRFDVYIQRLTSDFTLLNDNLALATGLTYENGDNSATWTPRPSVVSSGSGFLVAWFEHTSAASSEIWQAMGQLITDTQTTNKFELMTMNFGQSHLNDEPTGFLTTSFDPLNQEFALGVTSQLESFVGYLPLIRLQRFTANGHLLRLDGSLRATASVGDRLDLSNAAQLSMAMTSYTVGARSGYLLVYAKNAIDHHARDYDVWRSDLEFQSQTPTPTSTSVVTLTPTNTAQPSSTSTSTATSTPMPTPTNPSGSASYQQNLPLIMR